MEDALADAELQRAPVVVDAIKLVQKHVDKPVEQHALDVELRVQEVVEDAADAEALALLTADRTANLDAMDAVVLAIMDALVDANLLAVHHAGRLLSNFYI